MLVGASHTLAHALRAAPQNRHAGLAVVALLALSAAAGAGPKLQQFITEIVHDLDRDMALTAVATSGPAAAAAFGVAGAPAAAGLGGLGKAAAAPPGAHGFGAASGSGGGAGLNTAGASSGYAHHYTHVAAVPAWKGGGKAE